MNVALIAHDGKKPEMISFTLQHRKLLQKAKLFATGTTGKHIAGNNFQITCLLSGPNGGDAQIAAMVAEKKLDLVIFFRDPLDKHPHEPDVQMLMRICDVHNVPLATNTAGAKLMLQAALGKCEE